MEQIPAPQVNIRNLSDADIAAIVNIDRRIGGAERNWPQKASTHFRTYSSPLSFVAETEGKVVGFIMGDLRGAEYSLPLSGWIDILGVDPDFQERGIGRALVEAFVRSCNDQGVKARALVPENNVRLRNFLKSAQFERGTIVEYVRGFA